MKLSASEIEILRIISYTGGLSRKELAIRSGLSQAGLTKITKTLMQNGFILEGEHISYGVGRKEILLYSNPRKFTFLGVDIGGYRIRLAVSDNNLKIIHKTEFLLSELSQEKDKTRQLIERIRLFLLTSDVAKHSLAAIGIGVTGIVDAQQKKNS